MQSSQHNYARLASTECDFAGSPRGGHAAATFFTLIESCKRAGHNTFDYLSDVLRRIGDHPVNRLDELLPDRWQPSP